jgi:dipeptidase D
MQTVLGGLSQYTFFRYFEEISRIPRGSGNTKAISDYCVQFAQKHHLWYVQDALGNVYMRKDASRGRELDGGILLQGHLDMVTEKKPSCSKNMATQGLELAVDGDFLYAKDTTLGGDDGIAIAYALAILADDSISHPTLEVVFTVDEEIGMLGAQGMDLPEITARYMLNMDSEEQGVLWVGCAGGMTAHCNLPVVRESFYGTAAKIKVEGLTGGHSGSEINKERANACIVLGQILFELRQKCLFAIEEVNGGLKDNAIPRQAQAEIIFDLQAQHLVETSLNEKIEESYKQMKQQKLALTVKEIAGKVQSQYALTEPDLKISLEWEGERNGNACDYADTDHIIFYLRMVPNGVQNMSVSVPELVETSLNLGVMSTTREKICIQHSIRSSVESRKWDLEKKVQYLTESLGGDCYVEGDYPGWNYEKESVLRDTMRQVYTDMFGQAPQVAAVHAGLECGYFKAKYPHLDIVSFGPNIYDIHTTEEKMSISSCNEMYVYLIKLLEVLK